MSLTLTFSIPLFPPLLSSVLSRLFLPTIHFPPFVNFPTLISLTFPQPLLPLSFIFSYSPLRCSFFIHSSLLLIVSTRTLHKSFILTLPLSPLILAHQHLTFIQLASLLLFCSQAYTNNSSVIICAIIIVCRICIIILYFLSVI